MIKSRATASIPGPTAACTRGIGGAENSTDLETTLYQANRFNSGSGKKANVLNGSTPKRGSK
jgi:hypothetical protein